MKILAQDRQNNLAWQEVIYKGGHFRSPDESRCYENYSIYAIKDDNRNKTVVCSACGAEIPNTPASIRAHRNMVNKPSKCFECEYMRQTNEKVTSQKYVLNDDGTYSESTKRNVRLACYRGWRHRDINSDEAKRGCKYAACEEATFTHIKDFWTQYPDAFDEFITIDTIIDAGYKSLHKYPENITITLKGKLNIEAWVNNQGICYCFYLNYRRSSYMLRYSKKYNKVWVLDGNRFKELDKLDLSNEARETIIKKLSALYE